MKFLVFCVIDMVVQKLNVLKILSSKCPTRVISFAKFLLRFNFINNLNLLVWFLFLTNPKRKKIKRCQMPRASRPIDVQNWR